MKKGDVIQHRYNKKRIFYFDAPHYIADKWIFVTDDKGLRYYLPLSDFFTIKEIRKMKLNKINESTL